MHARSTRLRVCRSHFPACMQDMLPRGCALCPAVPKWRQTLRAAPGSLHKILRVLKIRVNQAGKQHPGIKRVLNPIGAQPRGRRRTRQRRQCRLVKAYRPLHPAKERGVAWSVGFRIAHIRNSAMVSGDGERGGRFRREKASFAPAVEWSTIAPPCSRA